MSTKSEMDSSVLKRGLRYLRRAPHSDQLVQILDEFRVQYFHSEEAAGPIHLTIGNLCSHSRVILLHTIMTMKLSMVVWDMFRLRNGSQNDRYFSTTTAKYGLTYNDKRPTILDFFGHKFSVVVSPTQAQLGNGFVRSNRVSSTKYVDLHRQIPSRFLTSDLLLHRQQGSSSGNDTIDFINFMLDFEVARRMIREYDETTNSLYDEDIPIYNALAILLCTSAESLQLIFQKFMPMVEGNWLSRKNAVATVCGGVMWPVLFNYMKICYGVDGGVLGRDIDQLSPNNILDRLCLSFSPWDLMKHADLSPDECNETLYRYAGIHGCIRGLRNLGVLHFGRNEVDVARKCWLSALNCYRTNIYLCTVDDEDDAEELAESNTEEYSLCECYLANLLIMDGKHSAALAILTRHPLCSFAWYKKGNLYEITSRFPEAYMCYDSAMGAEDAADRKCMCGVVKFGLTHQWSDFSAAISTANLLANETLRSFPWYRGAEAVREANGADMRYALEMWKVGAKGGCRGCIHDCYTYYYNSSEWATALRYAQEFGDSDLVKEIELIMSGDCVVMFV